MREGLRDEAGANWPLGCDLTDLSRKALPSQLRGVQPAEHHPHSATVKGRRLGQT